MSQLITNIKIKDMGTEFIDQDTTAFFKCKFCEKETIAYPHYDRLTEIVSGGPYCSFCTRNEYYTKKNKNILIASYRGIIGYIYYYGYKYSVPQAKVYVSDINEMISNHVSIGKLNPVFNYDEESYCWFVDFSRVGKYKRQIDVQDVKNTFTEMLTAFNLYSYLEGVTPSNLAARYHEAVDTFYKERRRPDGKRLLIPTLKGCGVPVQSKITTMQHNAQSITYRNLAIEEYRSFKPSELTLIKF